MITRRMVMDEERRRMRKTMGRRMRSGRISIEDAYGETPPLLPLRGAYVAKYRANAPR